MIINEHIEQLTDQYLRGELSGGERSSFEQLMSNDQAVAEHVHFQKQLVNGLADYRKLQLKSRLDAIQVAPGILGGASFIQATLKIASGIALVAVVGFGLYNIVDFENDNETVHVVDINDGSKFITTNDTSIPEKPEVRPSTPVASIVETTEDSNESNTPDIAKTGTGTSSKFPIKTVAEAKESSDFVPKVNIPSLNDISDTKEFTPEEVSIPKVSGNDITEEESSKPIDVKTINRKIEEIKYRYFDGKLFLYGDFKREPYEILEINSSSSRDIYLYYTDKYYKIQMTDDVKTLSPIVDSKLIKELKIIRDNKLD